MRGDSLIIGDVFNTQTCGRIKFDIIIELIVQIMEQLVSIINRLFSVQLLVKSRKQCPKYKQFIFNFNLI